MKATNLAAGQRPAHPPQTEPPDDSRFDFGRELDHRGTLSIKWEFNNRGDAPVPWDATAPEHGDQQVLPMWVADMDFATAPEIRAAVQKRAAHGVFGYARASDSYLTAVCDWMRNRQGWQLEPEWVVSTPGVVAALHLIVRRFSEPGDRVLIQRPVYHPFSFAAETNQRELVVNPLRLRDGRYEMDFADLAAKVRDPKVKIALLCNPHNPVGRAWSAADLQRYGELCAEHDVLVVADEIHADLTLPGREFTPYASTGDALYTSAIICTAASKAFNLAGLSTANLVIRDQALRESLRTELQACGIYGSGVFGLVATEAAYREGEAWLDAALVYIDANFAYLDDFLRTRIPRLTLTAPEGTYLAWIDCRKLGLEGDALDALMFDQARIYLDDGQIFGAGGAGFIRINVACPRSVLCRALERIEHVVNDIT